MLSRILIFFLFFFPAFQWCYFTTFGEGSDPVNQVDWSLDDGLIISGSDSNRAILYQAQTLNPLCTKDMGRDVLSVKISPDKTMFAVGLESSSTVKIYSTTPPCNQIRSISTSHGTVNEVDFNPDNSKLLTCGNDEHAREWNISTGAENKDIDVYEPAIACRYSDNGFIGIVDDDPDQYLYNLGGTKIGKSSFGDEFNEIIFKPGSDHIFYGADKNKKVYIATYPDNTSTSISPSPSFELFTIDFAKDSGEFVTGGDQGYLHFYYANNNSVLATFRRDNNDIYSLRYSSTSSYLLAAKQNGQIDVYRRLCNGCPSGSYQSVTGCIPCSLTMTACSICRNSSECLACSVGYFLNGTKLCEPCNVNNGCVTCESSTVCISCSQEYYLNGAACSRCDSIITGCQECVNQTSCVKCQTNYQLQDESCTECSQNCLLCNSSQCLQCQYQYYQINGTCESCPNNCINCNTTQCKACAPGYQLSSGNCILCPSLCDACNASGYCFGCSTGSFLSTGVCGLCSPPCYTCQSTSTTCDSCIQGFYLSSPGTCTVCSNCPICDSSGNCLSCFYGYYLSGTSCQSCTNSSSNCLTCSGSDCLVCQINYELTSALTCQKINKTDNCVVYQANTTDCQTCNIGFYLNGVQCSNCEENCAKCINQTECEQCFPGYYLDSANCLSCPANCEACQSSTVCSSCSPLTYLNGNDCSLCSDQIPHCSSCVNSTYCTSCHLSFYLSSSYLSCISCSSPCATCNASQCFSCEFGHYLNAGSCQQCPNKCSECSSSANCTACVPGTVLQAGVCNNCQDIYKNCAFCNQTQCLQCHLTYELNSSNLCSDCFEGCEVCDPGLCLKCQYGYYLSNANTSCEKCLQNCVQCSSINFCHECISGFYPNNSNLCQPCIDHCLSCSNGTQCQICHPTTILNNKVCDKCQIHMSGCKYCSATNICEQCIIGYYQASAATCSLCKNSMEGCEVCSSSMVCFGCGNGYYLENDLCYRCNNQTGCAFCNQSTCFQCQWGYYIENGICLQCSSNISSCAMCEVGSGCIQCLSGYYLNNSQCQSCSVSIEGCIFCNATDCLQCQAGYYLQNNLCNPCRVQGCEVCNISTCLLCDSHYYLNGQICSPCSASLQGCFECNAINVCVTCETGFYLDSNDTCTLCEDQYEGCDVCSPAQCFNCQTNYFLNGSVCSKCSEILDGCAVCLNQNTCLSCDNGYYLENGTCSSCTKITGCIICQNSSSCIYCSEQYYLSGQDCLKCSDNMIGCIACISQTVCTLCGGSYELVGGQCQELKGQSPKQYSEIKLETVEETSQRLKHTLYAVNDVFVQIEQNWETDVELFLVDKSDGSSIKLQILDVQWGKNQYTLIFTTNNPVSTDLDEMPFVRRLLSSFSINYQIQMNMKQEVINEIYPNFQINSDLLVDYPLQQPLFYKSLLEDKQYYYFIFGIITLALLLFVYCVKLCCTKSMIIDTGFIIPQVMAFKAGSLAIYPTFPEYINYCYGFAIADLPWLNQIFGSSLSNLSEYTPNPYLMQYQTLNLSSTYLLGLLVYGTLAIVLLIIRKCWNNKIYKYEKLLYNWWIFGLAFAGFCCLQGAILNPISSLSANAFFYILGISLYILVFFDAIYSTYQNTLQFHKIRVLVKASLLSLLHISPVQFFAVIFTIDSACIVYMYTLLKKKVPSPRIWVVSQLLLLCALCLVIFLPSKIIGLILTSLLILVGIGLDMHVQYMEYFEEQKVKNLHEENNSKIEEEKFEIQNMDSIEDIQIEGVIFEMGNEKKGKKKHVMLEDISEHFGEKD